MKKKRGIILISTLLLIFFLVLVSSAFININTNNLRLTTSVRDQELATLAAMSGVKYAQMRLEQFTNDSFSTSWGGCTGTDRNFTGEGIPTGVSKAFSSITENGNSGLVTGNLRNGAQFLLAFACEPKTTDINGTPSSYNNLSSITSQPRSASYRNVPQRSVHLIVVGSAGGVSRTVEVILKKQVLTDSSAFAGNNLTVGIASTSAADNLWYINSVDPFDNSVRANGNITAPTLGNPSPIDSSMANGTFSSSYVPGFTFTGGNKGDIPTLNPNNASLGAIVSKTTISFNGTVVGEGTNDDNETIFAKQQTGGVLHPNTTSEKPPELNASDVTPASSKCVYALAPGTYVVDTEQHIYSVEAGSNCLSGCTASIPNLSRQSGTDCASSIDLPIKDYILRIPKDINVQVNGDFKLQLDPVLMTGQRAKLALKYNDDGYQSGKGSPTFHAKGGNITISGELTGEGGIVADDSVSGKGNVTLEGRSVLSTDPSSGVAIYADADVNINPVKYTGATSGNTDFTAYKQAIKAQDSNSYLSGWESLDKDNNAGQLRDRTIGSATWDGTKLNITFTDSSTSSITIPSGNLIYKGGTPSTTDFCTSSPITLGQYVRAKYKESHPASKILTYAVSNATIANKLIKPTVDNFWEDKENIESQVANDLENSDKVDDNTTINNVFNSAYGCSSPAACDKYKEVKDKDILVSFKDYWTDTVAFKFDVGQQSAYNDSFNMYWNQSKMTSAQELSPQDIEFTGVIYTKGNLIAKMGTGTESHKFFIEGSIISLNGDIDIKNARKIQFLYNPEYLTSFMNQTGSSVQTRLQQVFWVMW